MTTRSPCKFARGIPLGKSLTTPSYWREERMTQYTLTLTETNPKGINGHGKHFARRLIAKARAKSLGYKVKKITEPTPGDGVAVQGVYQWIIDDQDDPSLDPSLDLKLIFEYYGFVTVTVA
jgi:hypothetical protein